MKRRLSSGTAGPSEGSRSRRQPQISCNFCRSKKLKCDRGQPCSNCTTRGISCDGQSLPSVSRALETSPSSDQDVLQRLRRLEETVFGSIQVPLSDAHQGHDSQKASPSRPVLDKSNDLDYNNGGDSLAPDDCDTFTLRIRSSGEYPGVRPTSTRCVDLPSQEDALDLFDGYLESSDTQIPSLLHPPSVRTSIDEVYTQLRQRQRVNLGSAALVLGLCAGGAFFWEDDSSNRTRFLSEDHAAAQCVVWRTATWDLLDQVQRTASHSLDAIQARLVLADVLYNVEGSTSRYRYVQSCARSAAYELRLHLTDLPGNGSGDTPFLQEIKRRLWWHIASTDWLLSAMGGNLDRVYAVNPKHMKVNYPSHASRTSISSADSFDDDWSEITLIHMNVRIRLAEVLRDTVDALPLGSGDVDTLSFSKIEALNRQFEQILIDCPPFNIHKLPVDAASRRIALQRATGFLSIQARRARFLRPFIQIRDLSEKFKVFRRQCFDAAQIVMETASNVLTEAVDTPRSTASETHHSGKRSNGSKPRRSPYHSGLVINHLFMACAVLAADPSLRGGPDGAGSTLDAETERRRAQLANACRLLEKAGEKSPMARGMVTRLVGVLRKHRIHGMGEDKYSLMNVPETKNSEASSSAMSASYGDVSLRSQEFPGRQDLAVHPYTPGLAQSQQQQQQEMDAQNFTYESLDPSALNGIWNDLLGTDPTNMGWNQLFADLDFLSGGM